MAYSIEQFIKLNKPQNIVITQHSRKRFTERNIKLTDVIEGIKTETIIEEYPDDFPFPSCLILGKTNGVPIHICASTNEGLIYIITAYIPNYEKWEDDFRTRKER